MVGRNLAVKARITSDSSVTLAILALAVGAFAIGTGEFAIMGLLPGVASDLGISEPLVRRSIAAYALGVVVGAPAISILAARAPRRAMLISLMLLFAVANFATAAAPNYSSLILVRFVSGLPHGAYFGIAALVAASLVETNWRARAVGRVMLGMTTSTLLGLPLCAWVGQAVGWRPIFSSVGGIGLVTAALIARYVPRVAMQIGASPLQELSALRQPQVWLTLAIAAVGCGGMFSVFTYVVPLLTDVAGVPIALVPLILPLFGVGMTLGNIVGAYFADKALMPTIGFMLTFGFLVLLFVPVTALHPITASLTVLCVGLLASVSTALQTRLMDVAAEGQTLAATLNHAAFNLANALGALFGGMAIAAGYGFASTGLVGAGLAAAGLVVFAISWLADRPRPCRAVG
jgi:DHA1 family inner membrane transport protein